MSQDMTDEGRIAPRVLVVMGVSGVGKTTFALALNEHLRWPFQEGDELHPAANVEKMRAGTPLTDADRDPWLHEIARWIDARLAAGEPGIITCSALKRRYRQIIVGDHDGAVRIVYLKAARAVLADRVARRKHQYMPPSLLDSQLETLQEPTPDEHPMVVLTHRQVEQTVAEVLAYLRA